jgi:hypothetical protein
MPQSKKNRNVGSNSVPSTLSDYNTTPRLASLKDTLKAIDDLQPDQTAQIQISGCDDPWVTIIAIAGMWKGFEVKVGMSEILVYRGMV